MKTSILCAISHSYSQPYLSILEQGQEKTWLKEEIPPNIEVIHFHGPPPSKTLQLFDKAHERIRWENKLLHRLQAAVDNTLLFPWKRKVPTYQESQLLKVTHKAIQIDFPDTYLTYRWKLLGLLSYFLTKTDHDFLLTTTTSSYLRMNVLSEKIENFSERDFYYGAAPYPSAGFASGSNRVFSRKTVEKIFSSRSYWPPGTIEDVAVGNLLRKMGVKAELVPIVNISSIADLETLSDNTLNANYHYRLKSGTFKNRNDVDLMIALHSRIRNSK